MTCQNCSDPAGNDMGAYCPACLREEFPPVSALGVAERLRNAEKVYRPIITETRFVVLGSTLGMMLAVIVVASFIVWLTL